ncbi:MAG: hypothetical protein ACOX1X_10500 [Dethiobacteria bacterium]
MTSKGSYPGKKWGILYILGCTLLVVVGSLWVADPDVFWHLKIGEWIFWQRAVPRTDIYSWSVYGQPWIAHQWLWEVLIYSLHRYAGILGLWCLAFLMIFLTGLLLKRGLLARGVALGNASAAGAMAPLLLIGWLKPWPQAGVYALFSAYLFLSLRDRWGWKEVLSAAGLGLLWGNIHSTALMFPLLLLAETIWSFIFYPEKRKTVRLRLAAAGAAAIATLLNPHGLQLWAYAVREGLLSQQYRENIYSWMPYVFGFNILTPIFFISIIILFMAVRQGQEKELAFVRAAGFWILALMSRIYAPYAVLSTAALLGLLTFKLTAEGLKRLAILALAAGLVLLPVRGVPPDLETVARKGEYPVEAVHLIKQRGYENVFNDHGWGGYLLWKEVPVYIDGRNDVYGELLTDFLHLHQTEKPLGQVLAEKGARTVLTGVNSTRDLALRESLLWQRVYRDEDAVVYILREKFAGNNAGN